MKPFHKSIPLAAVVSLAVASLALAAPGHGIRGQRAPAWQIETWYNLPEGVSDDDRRLKLSDFKGKVVYLFCFQSWCPGCHSHGFPTLKHVRDTFKDDPDVVILAVQTVFEGLETNTLQRGRETLQKFELQIPLAHDVPTGDHRLPSIMRDYRTGGTPWTIVIDRGGIVRFNGFRPNQELAVALVRAALAATPDTAGSEARP